MIQDAVGLRRGGGRKGGGISVRAMSVWRVRTRAASFDLISRSATCLLAIIILQQSWYSSSPPQVRAIHKLKCACAD